jgi:hypothetical protein
LIGAHPRQSAAKGLGCLVRAVKKNGFGHGPNRMKADRLFDQNLSAFIRAQKFFALQRW